MMGSSRMPERFGPKKNGGKVVVITNSSTRTFEIDVLTASGRLVAEGPDGGFRSTSKAVLEGSVDNRVGWESVPRRQKVVAGISSTDKDALYYNMQHKYRGKAVIFNHEHFQIKKLERRLGTGQDCLKLESTLKKLGFDVSPYVDLTLEELNEKLDHWAKQDYTDYDCFLMAVLSHGNQGIIYAKDRPYIPEDNLWGRFTGDKCITLASKPKLFFIQTCQGKSVDDGVHLRTQVDGDPSFKIPIYADCLIAYSTVPDFFSWRNPLTGSWFIQALCDIFDKYGFELDLLAILTLVNRQVAMNYESNVPDDLHMHQKKQIPCFTSMLTRMVKFEKKN